MPSPQTLVDALDKRASSFPDRVAYRFLFEGEVEQDSITFGDLRRRARAAAANLLALKGNSRHGAAILLYPQGIEFIVAFLGCLYAGVIAVPASIANRKRGIDILRRIAEDSGARWVLSKGAQLDQLARDIAEAPDFPKIPCIDIEQGTGRLTLSATRCEPDAIALLQYTSGSTGMPSGVALTNANLVHNQQLMQRGFEHDDDTVFVSWLPMFHDMGLGTVLMSIWSGRPCILMAPSVFVQNPRRWLAAISHYRGTTSLAPDFAYDLCVRRIGSKGREGLDLSSWRVAINGSEPVRSSTIERFNEAFGPCGFRREAFAPGYGLAESTLYVCSTEPRALPTVKRFSREALQQGEAVPEESGEGPVLVACGSAGPGTRILIVDPETREECAPGKIGEVWLQSGSVGVGYWNKDVETQYTFRARTADGRGPFLRTGDLAFVHEGRLFVAGRHKDLVIIRGRNHSPQDIEDSVSTCHPALVPRGCAAFSVDSDEGEQLVIVQEVARTALRTLDTADVYRVIRSVVSDHHALQTHAIVLLKPSGLPRTSSGKVRRKTCRQSFLAGTLPAVASWPATPQPESTPNVLRQSRESGQRADRIIEWLRERATSLSELYSKGDRHKLPLALSGALAKQGLLGMQVDTSHGGLGLGHFDSARVLEQLAAVDFSLALRVGANNCLGIQPIAKHASAEQKTPLLSRLAHGENFVAFTFDEREDHAATHQDLALMLTGEEPWRLSGQREFGGPSPQPSHVNVIARHDEPPGVSAFLIATGSRGVHLTPEEGDGDAIGFKRITIRFDGTPLGREDLLSSFGSGNEIAREAMLHMRLAVGASCIGAMKRCAQLVSRESSYRSFNGKATPNPVILSRLSSAAARVTALECLVHTIARAVDKGQPVPGEGFTACKLLGPEMLLRSIDDLMLVGVKVGQDESSQVLGIYKEASALRNFDGSPEALAESTGAAVMLEDTPLRLLLTDILGASAVVSWVDPVIDAVRHRMRNLKGTLARRAERWGHTRAGELTTWLVLLGAVEGCLATERTAALEHAHTWTLAQLEHAVSAVRLGTPSETATLDADDIAATFAAYARTIGNLPKEAPGVPGEPRRVQRSSSPDSGADARAAKTSADRDSAKRELRSRIISWLANRLRIPVSEVDAGRSFADHGLDSLSSVELAKSLSDTLGREIDATVVWSFATIDALAEHLLNPPPPAENADPPVVAEPPSAPSARPGSSIETQLEDEIAKLEHELRSRS
jgi:acyl-CoA synthetase (AMP-forming)/AMP-acid ligase II/alkylation response protein AidB-like acyl-CoA dehydrogenase/acyl carrier protein